MNFERIISTAPLFFVALAAITSWCSFFYPFPKVLRQFSMLWTFILLVEIAGHLLKQYNIKNHLLYNFQNVVLYLALPFIYQQVLVNSFFKKIIRLYFLIYPVFILVNSIFIQGIDNLQSLNIVVGGSFMLFLAAAYLWQLYSSEDNEKITKDPFFWFSVGFILFFGGTVPFLGMLNYLWKHYQSFTRFYYTYFSNSFVILLNILIIIGFLCRKNLQKSH
jgi:hypothetical protein